MKEHEDKNNFYKTYLKGYMLSKGKEQRQSKTQNKNNQTNKNQMCVHTCL